jgi:DME family drug/metabolite transporter
MMGYGYVVCAAVLWGLLGPASRFALRDGIDPLEIAFWRAAIAAVLFGAHAAALRRVRVERRDLPAVLAFGLVGIALFFASYMQAVRLGGASLAAVLLYTAPVWVALLAWLLGWETLGGRKVLALALTLVGVAGLAAAAGGEVRVGAGAILWGLVAGWAYATHYVFGKRYFPRYPTPTLFLYALPVGAVGLLPFFSFQAEKSATAWAVLVFLAVVPTYGSYLLYSAGLRRIEATRAATVATTEPVVAAIAAYLVWGEQLGAAGYLFAAVVLAGVLLVVLADGKNEEGAHPAV